MDRQKLASQFPGGKLRNEHPFYMYDALQEIPDCLDACMTTEMVSKMVSFLDQKLVDRVYLVGCGTSYNACKVVAYSFNRLFEIQAVAMDGLDFQFEPPADVDGRTLVISISHSGQSITVCESQAFAKRRGAITISITGIEGSRLNREANLSLVDPFGKEYPFGKTRSFLSSAFLGMLLAASLAGTERREKFIQESREINKIIRQNASDWAELTHEIAIKWSGKIDRYLMAGFGIHEAAVAEIALKCLEILGESAAAYGLEALAHGPCDSLRENVGVILFQTDQKILFRTEQISQAISESPASLVMILNQHSDTLAENSDWISIPEIGEYPVLAMFPCCVAAQYLVYFLAVGKNYNPDINGLDRFPMRTGEYLFPPGTH